MSGCRVGRGRGEAMVRGRVEAKYRGVAARRGASRCTEWCGNARNSMSRGAPRWVLAPCGATFTLKMRNEPTCRDGRETASRGRSGAARAISKRCGRSAFSLSTNSVRGAVRISGRTARENKPKSKPRKNPHSRAANGDLGLKRASFSDETKPNFDGRAIRLTPRGAPAVASRAFRRTA
jgi:hypothetical protein